MKIFPVKYSENLEKGLLNSAIVTNDIPFIIQPDNENHILKHTPVTG